MAGRASAGGARAAAATRAAATTRWVLAILLLPFRGCWGAARVRSRGEAGHHPLVAVLTPRWRGRHLGDLCAGPPPTRRGWSAPGRLTLRSADDASPCALSAKLLARPGLLDEIRAALPDRALAQLVPYDTTERDRELALALDIPMYGADPRHRHLG